MQKTRHIALRVLPLLVVAWMAFAVFGGALHTAKSVEPASGDFLAGAGMGLCAATVAVLFSVGAAQARPRSQEVELSPQETGRPSPRVLPRGIAASFAAPSPPLIQVFRT